MKTVVLRLAAAWAALCPELGSMWDIPQLGSWNLQDPENACRKFLQFHHVAAYTGTPVMSACLQQRTVVASLPNQPRFVVYLSTTVVHVTCICKQQLTIARAHGACTRNTLS